MKIEIKNYQRIEDIEINLSPGINLITGNSNNGKSSTIRAVRDFVFNKYSNDKIRHGEKKLEVNIDSVKSSRMKAATTFDIDGQLMEKVGRNALQEVYNIFKIGELDVNGVNIKPNFWFQMDKPFLFDKTPGQKHDLIIGSKNDKYLKALKSIKSNQLYLSKTQKSSIEDSINLIKKQNLDTTIAINNLDGIDELFQKMENFEIKKEKLELIKNSIEDLKKTKASVIGIRTKLKTINDLITCYEEHKVEFGSLDKDLEIIETLEEYNKEQVKLNKLSKELEEIENLLDTSKSISSNLGKYIEDSDILITLRGIVNDFKNIEKEISSVKENRVSIDKEIKDKEIKILDIKKELKYCPTCKKEF